MLARCQHPFIPGGISGGCSGQWTALRAHEEEAGERDPKTIVSEVRGIEELADADFIAHAREDVPRLIAALREARAEIGRLRGMFRAEDVDLLENYVCADDMAPIRTHAGSVQADIDDLAARIRCVIRELPERSSE